MRAPGLGLVSAALLLSLPARAVAPAQEAPPSKSYALPLGLSYAVLPALATVSAIFLPNADETEGALLVTGVVTVGLAAPIVVHAMHGQPRRAVISPLGALGGVLVVGLAGLGIGAIRESAECPAHSASSEEDGCGLGAMLPPMIVGAAVGYAAWAVFDTIENSGTEAREPSSVALVPRLGRGFVGVSVLGSL